MYFLLNEHMKYSNAMENTNEVEIKLKSKYMR